MPKFIIKVYKMYRGQIYRYTYKRETFEEMTRAVNVFKCFRYVYFIEAGELIYTDTDQTYFRRVRDWIRKR